MRTQGRTGSIELCFGDLTNVSLEQSIDLLVVSAFPDDYLPSQSSLIGALARKGVSVAELAQQKEVDLRHAFSCWLSHELIGTPPGVPYKRILCFEPLVRGQPADVVGEIFRALAPFLSGPPKVESVAMPIVAAGDQGYALQAILDPLLDAAIRWIRTGMPLGILKIVVSTEADADEAREVFRKAKAKWSATPREVLTQDFDVFISYAHEDRRPADVLASHLMRLSLRVFVDRHVIQEGAAWQAHIFSAIDRCRRLVAIYSPAYVASKVCQEEFNIAWARGRRLEVETIFPVYWSSADLPTYMTMLVYADCREQEEELLRQACARVADACAG